MNTRLSVNINKVALIRNSRPGGFPNIYRFAQDCESYGAQGITVHPRPDQRHIRYEDLPILKDCILSELNVEGNPTPKFVRVVKDVKPHQVTLVPDLPEAATSNEGWDTLKNASFLSEITREFQNEGIRVSIFIDPVLSMVEGAKKVGADCIELYTGRYAYQYTEDKNSAVNAHSQCAKRAHELGLKVNAGHDLNLQNLGWYKQHVYPLHEVSIGHALTVDALYYGIQNTIRMYKELLS